MAKTIARLKDGDLLLTGEINERLPIITDGLVAHYPFDGVDKKYLPNRIRYIRDWLNGSTSNTSNHWVEIQAIDLNGVNVALGKSATTNGTGTSTLNLLTDGSTATSPYNGHNTGLNWVAIDLDGYFELKEIKVWHYYGDGRTYHNTKTEVSDDGVHWYTIFDSAIEGEYKETSTGKTHSLMNLGTTVKPLVNINTTLTYDGIAVEESTVNAIDSSALKDGSQPWGRDTSNVSLSTTKSDSYMMPHSVVWSKLDKTGVGNCYITGSSKIDQSITSTSWTFSCYVKRVDGKPVTNVGSVYLYINSSSTGTRLNSNANPTSIYYVGNGWYKVVRTDTVSESSKVSLVGFSSLDGSTEWLFSGWQLEAKLFPTSFTDESRDGDGILEIPINNINSKTQSFSINFEIAVNGDTKSGSYHTNKSIYLQNFGSIWRYLPLSSDTRKFVWDYHVTSGSSRIYKDLASSTAFEIDKFETITITWDLTSVRIYRNGEIWGTEQSLSTCTLGIIDKISFNKLQAKVKNFSIYNKKLSDEEVKKLSNNTFTLNENGDILTDKISESTLKIPSDAIHIPLDFNSKDRLRLIGASEDINTVYESGSVWVGSATTNLVSSPEFSNFSMGGSWNGWDVSTLSFLKVGIVGRTTYATNISKRANGATNAIHQVISGLTVGKQYTLSFYARINPSSTVYTGVIKGYIRAYEEHSITKEWKRISITQDATSTSHTIHITQSSIDYDVQVALIQLQSQSFSSVFTHTSIGDGVLEFNLNNSYQLDWSKDWTIAYWKKPIGTNNDALTGYNIDSLGCNGNTVGGGYIWWGKSTGSNSNTRPSYSFSPSDYFGNWEMICLVKRGGTIYFKSYNKLGIFESESNSTTTVSNYYVTQYGYDLKLGGYDNTNSPNSYYRDLIVSKRAFTDEEIERMYKVQMSYDNRLTVSKNIVEDSNFT